MEAALFICLDTLITSHAEQSIEESAIPFSTAFSKSLLQKKSCLLATFETAPILTCIFP